MDKTQIELAKVIERYFGADAGYLDIDVFTLARRIMEDGWTKPVRCKDCQFYLKRGGNNFWCDIFDKVTSENNFCFYGERKTDG